MKRTPKPIVAGIFIIIKSVYMLLFLAPALFVGGGMYSDHLRSIGMMITSLAVFITAILGLISGIEALRRKKWWLTLASPLLTILVCLGSTVIDRTVMSAGKPVDVFGMVLVLAPILLAIPALVLLILSRGEFE